MKWNEHQLETRDSLIAYFTRYLARELGKVNSAFRFLRIETPIVLPYTVDKGRLQTVQIRLEDEQFVLRENTVTGAYDVTKDILSGKASPRQKLPIVVWQHGKIFSRTAVGITESYHLEYQVLFSKTTGMPYDPIIMQAMTNMIFKQCGTVTESEDGTIYDSTKHMIATIRHRDDFWAGKNIEVVVNIDTAVLAAINQERFGRSKKPASRS
jgi:hypothetical protein